MESTAFKTWNKLESIEETEARIHDGVPNNQLLARAEGYIAKVHDLFPSSFPTKGGSVLEVGSGLAYLMQAVEMRFAVDKVIGLDVAENMIDKAKKRLIRDGLNLDRFDFIQYDGINVPCPDDSFECIFSISTLQHIPKEYVYHLFGELKRLIKPSSKVVFQVPSYSYIPVQQEIFPLQKELNQQIYKEEGHWHFFYSFKELFYILTDVYAVKGLKIREVNDSFWVCFSK